MGPLIIGDIEIHWLKGGAFELDGGAMFGVVPRVLWSKRYPPEGNNIRIKANPLLIKAPGANVVLDTGLGNKLTEKQSEIFRLSEPWDVPRSLKELGMGCEDIDFVVLTHCDFDHAGGIVTDRGGGELALTFPRARHVIQKAEWEDALNPNRRAANTYWDVNLSLLADSGGPVLADGDYRITEGVKLLRTGGHTRGHQIAWIESGGGSAVHMADLLPTHVHFNPLWVTAYDNFPLETIERKEALEGEALSRDAWFTFYHDPFMRACRFDHKGNVLKKLEY